jgi:hypothetical protein
MMSNSRELASGFLDRGWQPIPIPWAKKKPVLNRWQELRLIKDDLAAYFGDGPMNIGVLLGEPSGGLVDVDLDCQEAIGLAPGFLPETACRFGRKSKTESHWEYIASLLIKTAKFQDVDGQGQNGTAMIVEIRSTGCQTVFPGSMHPSGERIEWVSDGAPTILDGALLRRKITYLAVAAMLARHWPSVGSRDETGLAAAGFFARAGVDQATARQIIVAAARVAGDEEWHRRGDDVPRTFEKFRVRQPITAGPRLGELLRGNGTKVVTEMQKWLGKCIPEVSDLPAINAADLDLRRVTAAAWDAVLAGNTPPIIFRHGGLLVRVKADDDGTPRVETLSADRLRHRLANVAGWYTETR